MVGARALWDVSTLHSVFLTRAEASSIGIASIGARLALIEIDDQRGLYIRFPDPKQSGRNSLVAPIAPGIVKDVAIADWQTIDPGELVTIGEVRGTIALDGEREIELLEGMQAAMRIKSDGPWVVDFDRALQSACASG